MESVPALANWMVKVSNTGKFAVVDTVVIWNPNRARFIPVVGRPSLGSIPLLVSGEPPSMSKFEIVVWITSTAFVVTVIVDVGNGPLG